MQLGRFLFLGLIYFGSGKDVIERVERLLEKATGDSDPEKIAQLLDRIGGAEPETPASSMQRLLAHYKEARTPEQIRDILTQLETAKSESQAVVMQVDRLISEITQETDQVKLAGYVDHFSTEAKHNQANYKDLASLASISSGSRSSGIGGSAGETGVTGGTSSTIGSNRGTGSLTVDTNSRRSAVQQTLPSLLFGDASSSLEGGRREALDETLVQKRIEALDGVRQAAAVWSQSAMVASQWAGGMAKAALMRAMMGGGSQAGAQAGAQTSAQATGVGVMAPGVSDVHAGVQAGAQATGVGVVAPGVSLAAFGSAAKTPAGGGTRAPGAAHATPIASSAPSVAVGRGPAAAQLGSQLATSAGTGGQL